VTRECYAVLVFEREALLRGGQGVRLTVGASWPGTQHLTWRFDVPMESSMRTERDIRASRLVGGGEEAWRGRRSSPGPPSDRPEDILACR
jgi:hypothetical protein